MASLTQHAGNLGQRLAAHLLRRLTFAPTKDRIDTVANMTADAAVDELFNFQNPSMAQPIDPETGQEWIDSGAVEGVNSEQFKLREFVRAWWMEQAIQDHSAGHKLTFFLHSIWNTHYEAMGSQFFFDHIRLLRMYAKGNYKQLAEKMTLNNFMLRYLDNGSNTDDTINENYAREFLELFTIGKGPQVGPGDYTNYTEHDVAEATKVLTGFRIDWLRESENIDPETGIYAGFPKYWGHVVEDKTFSAAFGNQTITTAELLKRENGSYLYTDESKEHMEAEMLRELRDFIDMVFNQIETARYIVRKMYRFFVSSNIDAEIEADIIQPLATQLSNDNYDLEPTMKRLFKSVHFFDEDDSVNNDEIIGSLIKSPLDLVTGMMSQLEISSPNPLTDSDNHYNEFYRRSVFYVMFENAGFGLFAPPSVAGYPAYYQAPTFHRNWFNSGTIIARFKLPEMFITGKRVISWGTLGGVKMDVVQFVKDNIPNNQARQAAQLVAAICQLMMPEFPDSQRFAYFLDDILMNNLPYFDWRDDWDAYVNDPFDAMKEGAVRAPLEDLFTAIIYAPEYQLM
ncbi:MAG: DUF1800 family protein [Saprospiraceae bacterium]